jgi:hypothetical protein
MGYGCRENFLFSASNPNSGIKANLCIVLLVRLERIVDAGVDFLIVTLFICICSCLRHYWIASGLRPTLRVLLHITGSITDIWLAPYMWLGGCQFLLFSGHGFYNGWHLAKVKETISESPLWLHAHRLRSISSLHSPSSHVKLAKDK